MSRRAGTQAPESARGNVHLLLGSPVGPLLVRYTPAAVCSLEFWAEGAAPPAGTRTAPDPGDALGEQVVRELGEYFAGGRRVFTLPLAPEGTAFQRRVWEALGAIPAGQTRTYAQVAASVGSPRATRAVGQANRRNPIPILIPCHRVVAADGGLGGYMGSWEGGSGSGLKRWLLRLEAGGECG